MKKILLFLLILSFNLFAQYGVNEFNCRIQQSGNKLSKISSTTLSSGSKKLAIILCVEKGQSKILSQYFYNYLKSYIEDYYNVSTFNKFHVYVPKILVDSSDANNVYAFELRDYLVPFPQPIDTNFVAQPWLVKDILGRADAKYNFAEFDSEPDGYVDLLAFWVVRFNSGWNNGTGGLSINTVYTTKDTSNTVTKELVKIDGRNYGVTGGSSIIQRTKNADEVYAVSVCVHEFGHALFIFDDMDHNSDGNYNNYALGYFCSMSHAVGFNRVASPYNPVYCVKQNWVTPVNITSGTVSFSDFKNTGSIYKYTMPTYDGINYPGETLYFTYHDGSSNNYWYLNWPIPTDAQLNRRGVLIWQENQYGSWGNATRRYTPIDIIAAHGKWKWDESKATFSSPDTVIAKNLGIADPIMGLDSLEVRYSYIRYIKSGNSYIEVPAGGPVGSASCFYNPASPKTFAFYTNPNSNSIFANNIDPTVAYARSVTSEIKMSNLRFEGGSAKADFILGPNANVVSENATLKKGKWYINTDLTVSAGITLTIEAGTELYFATGKKLIVNGTFNAIGNGTSKIIFAPPTIFTTWGGIQFNSGSGGTLDYCDITYAATGINIYNSSPTIKHSSIDNCSGVGVYCDYYSSPVLVGNNIRYNTSYGLRCNVYSSPNLTDNGYPGSNVIRNNSSNGIFTAYNCNPNLNGYMTSGNSVFDNTSYEVAAHYNSTVNANKVYWGTAFPPPDAEFYASSSTINRSDPLQANPNPSRSMLPSENNYKTPTFSIMSSQGDDLNLAEEKQKEGKYDEAINMFLDVFKKEKENSKGRYALIKIEECFTQAGKKDFLDFSKKELKPLIKEEKELYVVLLELETHQLYNVGYKDYAMNNLKTILKKYNYNDEIEKQTLYRIGAFYLDLFNDTLNAEKTFDELAEKYPDDELLTYANMLLNEERYNKPNAKKVERLTETAETEEELLSNNPNPFNPTTIINYRVPENSLVTIKVYDVLGKEVAELVNEEKISGSYSVTFNASNLSSGIYFYTINAGKYSAVKKMLLVK